MDVLHWYLQRRQNENKGQNKNNKKGVLLLEVDTGKETEELNQSEWRTKNSDKE